MNEASLPTLFPRTYIGDNSVRVCYQVCRCDFQLQTTNTGTDVDERIVGCGSVHISRKLFFHSDGRTTSSNIAGYRKQIFHRYQIDLFVSRKTGCRFEVDFVVPGYDANEISRVLAFQCQGLENKLDRFVELLCYMSCCKVLFVDTVGNEFV